MWSRRPSDETRSDAALNQLAGTFLDMDRRQSIAESAVAAALALSPKPGLSDEWAGVQAACYEASAAYLDVTGRSSDQDSGGRPPTGAEIASAGSLLEGAQSGLDAFYARHRALLDSSANKVSAVSTDADAVLREAHAARQLLAGADQRLLGYPSVVVARNDLDGATAQLDLARAQGNPVATGEANELVRLAVAAVSEALGAAPQREEQARRTLASVRTRIDAVRTRTEGLPPLVSALLREFNARSSADLVDNDKTSRSHIDRAEALLAQAVAARDGQRPEDAIALANQARSELADAERDVDAVADRLALLREVKSEPAKHAGDVRFRLRDAQRLAVDRGVVAEWGSVLDAQAERIQRIVDGVTGAHPDYWAYHRSLAEVSEFITHVVGRIRQGAAR